jgi:hypothetical protein
LESLNPDEVYVLAKILPGFTGEKRLQAYKQVLREALEEGYANSSNSLEVLIQMRQQLDISEKEHLTVLTELGVEDPDLLNPSKQRTRENQVRLHCYRNQIASMVGSKRRRTASGLGRELLKVVQKEKSIQDVLPKAPQGCAIAKTRVRHHPRKWQVSPHSHRETSQRRGIY